jgi:hypothetical protein
MKIKIFLFSCLFMGVTAAPWFSEACAEGPSSLENFIYDDHDKRDPLWPLVSSSGAILNYEKDLMAVDMVLEGILVDTTGNNVAIINGMIVNLNDRIGLFIVKEIGANFVTLQKDDETVTLKLKKEE